MDQSRATSATPSSKQEKLRQIELKKQEKLLIELAAEKKQIRDHSKREENFKRLSNQRGWEDWKTWCQDEAAEGLRDELRAVSQSVTCLMDRSVHLVDQIKAHRSHAELQHLRKFQSHSDVVDYIMDIFKVFKEASNSIYDMEREKLINDFYVEAYNRDQFHHSRKVYYENLAHADVSMLKCRLNKLDENFVDKKFEIAADSVVKRDDHFIKVKKVEAAACAEIRNILNFFNTQLWPRKRLNQYQKALQKSTEVDAAIEESTKKIEEGKKTAASLSEKLQNDTREQFMKLSALKSEHIFLTKLTNARQEKFAADNASDRDRLLKLIEVCEKAKKILRQKLERGKIIQSIMEVCSKHEKLSDLMESSESLEGESSGSESSVNESSGSESLESFLQETSDGFLKKLARVESEAVMLRDYKANVTKENEKLCQELKEQRQQQELKYSFSLLRLDSSPSVGTICQISHQIPQIRTPIELRRRWKLCRSCKEFLCIEKTGV